MLISYEFVQYPLSGFGWDVMYIQNRWLAYL